MEHPEGHWNWSDKLAMALACVAGVMAIVLFWIEKTPFAAGISIGCIAGLLIFPILHFVLSKKFRILVFIVAVIALGLFGRAIWPRDNVHPPNLPSAGTRPSEMPEEEGFGKRRNGPHAAPFTVEIQTYSGAVPDVNATNVWFVRNWPSSPIASLADVSVFLQIVNMQPVVSEISRYSLEVKVRGKWLKTTKMDVYTAQPYFVPPQGSRQAAFPLSVSKFFDPAVADKILRPHEPARGWVSLKYPRGTVLPTKDDGVLEFRVNLRDAAGAQLQTAALKPKPSLENRDAQYAIFSTDAALPQRDLNQIPIE